MKIYLIIIIIYFIAWNSQIEDTENVKIEGDLGTM